MDCYFDEVECETGEKSLLKTVSYGVKAPRCIPVESLRASDFIHHTATAANTGTFEVNSITVNENGSVCVRVKMISINGHKFEGKLSYRQGDFVEVVK